MGGKRGSALILVVVLTSLLAVLGVMFVMVSRVDSISTSAVTDNKELSFAVDTVIADISKELADDVPSLCLDPCQPYGFSYGYRSSEYYDYPSHTLYPGADGVMGTLDDQAINPGSDGVFGPPARGAPDDDFANFGFDDDPWLANLEPEVVNVSEWNPADIATPIGFRHITDLYGTLAYKFHESYNPVAKALDPGKLDAEGERVSFRNLRAVIINPSAPIRMEGDKADADGDGVSDSRWVKIPNLYSKGRDVYAAVRIVDNGGMLNLNTGYLFDPCEIVDPCNLLVPHWQRIDGSSQTQVNLAALSQRDSPRLGVFPTAAPNVEAQILHNHRCNLIDPVLGVTLQPNNILVGYDPNVIWRYGKPYGAYTPFDIGDELKLHNRFILNEDTIYPRIDTIWQQNVPFHGLIGAFRIPTVYAPRNREDHSLNNYYDWFWLATNSDPNYDYRHISTVYNMDRTVDPNGKPMESVNHVRELTDRNNDGVKDILDLQAARRWDANELFYSMVDSARLRPDILRDANQVPRLAQLAVNMVDFIDSVALADMNSVSLPAASRIRPVPTVIEPVMPNGLPRPFYGFEAQPFITELGWIINEKPQSGMNYFAVELYNPSSQYLPLSDFEIELYDMELEANSVVITLGNEILPPNRCAVVSNYLEAFSVSGGGPRIEDSQLTLLTDYRAQDKGNPVEDPRGQRPRPGTPGGPSGGSGSSQGQADKGEPGKPQIWGKVNDVFLRRRVPVYEPKAMSRIDYIYVDRQSIPVDSIPEGGGVTNYVGRDCRSWHVVYQTMEEQDNSLGVKNAQVFTNHPFSFYLPNPLCPDNPYVSVVMDRSVTWAPEKFITIGDIVRVLTLGNSADREKTIGQQLGKAADSGGEQKVRLDLRNPYFKNIFQYLTVFDPNNDQINNDDDAIKDEPAYLYEQVPMPPPNASILHRWKRVNGDETLELKVRGKININTAPWFVIAQLPWVSQRQGVSFDPSLARAIVAYRDKTQLPAPAVPVPLTIADYSLPFGRQAASGSAIPLREKPGFESIGELNFVLNQSTDPLAVNYRIDKFARDKGDLLLHPDLTQTNGPTLGDGIPEDFEERDAIFSRISNLVTVRSDIFTAYILVRLGEDGPEKRMVAILDRSNVYRDRYRYADITNPDDRTLDYVGIRRFGDVKLIALHPVADPR